MKKNFVLQDDTTHKFWRVVVEESTLMLVCGRLETTGRAEEKKYDSPLEAKTEAKKLMAEKLKCCSTLRQRPTIKRQTKMISTKY